MSGGIIVPFGRIVKRIRLDVDSNGNIKIESSDLTRFSHIPGQPERPVPLSALETLYWLTKCASDALANTIKQIDTGKPGPAFAPAETETKTTEPEGGPDGTAS